MADTPPRVFIGSGEASLLERKTLIYSIRKNSRPDVEIYVFNGTHNAVEPVGRGEPYLAPMSLKVKYRNVTEFSNYRYLIPQLCGHEGRAVYLDSDMIAFGDVAELCETPMGDADFLAKAEAYAGTGRWGLSVMLFDCARCRFDLDLIFDEIDAGKYTLEDFQHMSPKFLSLHPYEIGELDPNWNMFDRHDERTRLIHYTDLYSQPWKFPGHPYGDVWFRYFEEARKAGAVTDRDLHLTSLRNYARQDILKGNDPPPPPSPLLSKGRRALGRVRRLISGRT